MKNLIKTLIIAAVFVCSTATAQNSKNTLDWAGTYKGTTGGGDIIIIEINTDLTYNYCVLINQPNYKDTIEIQGKFVWNKAGNQIKLSCDKTLYSVKENRLEAMYRKEETGFTLYKIDINDITEKYWKLIEINGNPVVLDSSGRQPHFILKQEGNRITGSGGCNTFTGIYEIDAPFKIKFSKVAATKMFCFNNMEVEQQLHQALENADNYTLSADGKFLSLNKGRMAPLARFEVVYLR